MAKSKVEAVRKFLDSADKVLVCTHATFRFAVEELGIEAFDNRLIAIDEFHHVSSNPGNVLGNQLGAFIARDKVHLVAMTGSYFRGDSEPVLAPAMRPGLRRSPIPTTNSSMAITGSSRWISATSSIPAVTSMPLPRCWSLAVQERARPSAGHQLRRCLGEAYGRRCGRAGTLPRAGEG